MFPKTNMTRNMKILRKSITTLITLMFNAISQKNNITEIEVLIYIFMWLKMNKTSWPKYSKIMIIKAIIVESFKVGNIVIGRRNNSINNVNHCNSSFPPKGLKTSGWKKKISNSIYNVPMFMFSTPIPLRCATTWTLDNGTMSWKKLTKFGISIFHGIICAKNFNIKRKLNFDQTGKLYIILRQLKMIFIR